MLVKIRLRKGMGFIIPIPFYALDTVIGAIEDIAWLSESFIGFGFFSKKPISGIISVVREIISELRQYGRWSMIQVDTEDAKVFVDFY